MPGFIETRPRTISDTSDEWLFYCEVKFSVNPNAIYQIGLTNWNNSIIMLTSFNEKSYIVKIKHNAHDAYFIEQLLRDELIYYQDTHYYLELNASKYKEKPVNVLKEFNGTLHSGNTIGFGMTEGGILVITVDGAEIGNGLK